MIRSLARAALAATFAAALVAAPADAQYATPRLALEGNALYGTMSGRDIRDLGDATGFDVQARLGVQAFSIGGGYLRTSQSVRTTSSDAVMSGLFVEPRLNLPFYYSSFTPYISGRLARLHQRDDRGITGLAATSVGGGLGVLGRVAPAVSVNLAGTYQSVRYRYDDVADPRGSRFTGTSFDLRAGLSLGFGG